MRSTFYKTFTIPLFSLLLAACGSSSPDTIAKYNGNWQSECTYDSGTDLTYIETLYITDTDYTIFRDEYDNSDCFGSSDFTTEIEGFLYYGDEKPDTSNFCRNTIEVDFTAAAIYEDDVQIAPSEISAYLNLPTNSLHDIICTRDDKLYTGDLTIDDGSTDADRPLSLNLDKPLFYFN